jgi:type I restriction enzyme S subunit
MEWKLKDLTVDGKGSYGIGAPAVPYQEDKLTYLRITDINDDGSLNFSDLKSVDAEDAEKYILKENDIVFARTGNSTGRSYFYEKQHGTFVYAGFLIKFSLDPNKVNPRILKYYTHSKPYFDWVNSFDTGATRGNINAKTYGDMEIELPSRKVQDKLVSILSSLDRKIELNNKINADLEEMAQAIFKNWFVDFEPFKDGKFVDSELGMIPEGWKVGRLDEISDVVGGSTPSKAKPEYYTQKGIAWLTPKDLSNHPAVYSSRGEIDITEEGYNSTSTKLMPKGTVLFTSRAPIGYISIAQNDICTNQGFKSLVPKKAGTCFLYCFLKYVTPEIENKSTGSTFKEASGSLMKSLQVLMPEQKVFEDFETIVSPLFARIEFLEKESSRLSLLRDTLLPRLMSGELEVPE